MDVTKGISKGAETAMAGGRIAKFAMKAANALDGMPTKLGRRVTERLGHPTEWVDKIGKAATGLNKEAKLGPVLSNEVDAALRRMTEHDPALKGMLDKAYGYAVFPLVGKATAALGIGFGRGEVFEQQKLIGYCGIVQLTLGVQVGGQTYDELILFENEGALERFKRGDLAFAMNASAVIVKAGAAATTNYSAGTAVFVHPEGGLMLELGIGGQKFIFRKKGLGAPQPKVIAEGTEGKRASQNKGGGETRGGETRGGETPGGQVQSGAKRAVERIAHLGKRG